MKLLFPTFILATILIVGCSKDDGDPMDDSGDCSSMSATYSSDIKAIIDSNCATSGCHDGSTSLPQFDNYDTVFAERAGIRTRVVARTMPPSGKTRSQSIAD